MQVDEFYTLSVREFCLRASLGETVVREMLKDGRLRAVRVGKKLLVDVASWREYMQRQRKEGVPEYDHTRPALEARMRKRAEAVETRPTLEEIGL